MASRLRVYSRIREVMTRVPEVVSPDLPLNDAWAKMRSQGFRQLPVVRDGKLVGLIAERALRLASAYEGSDQMKVQDAMLSHPFTVSQDAMIQSVCAQMATQRNGTALVIGAHGEPLGIFTAQDALRVLSEVLRDEASEGKKAA